MLRITRRWHDAANRILEGESRLLFVQNRARTIQEPTWGPQLPPAAPVTGAPAAATSSTRTSVNTLLSQAPVNEANAVLDAIQRDIDTIRTTLTALQQEVRDQELQEYLPPDVRTRIVEPLEQEVVERTAELQAMRQVVDAASNINAQLSINTPPKKLVSDIRTSMQKVLTALRDANQSTTAVEAFIQRLAAADQWISSTQGGTPDIFDDANWPSLTHDQRETAFERLQEIIRVPDILIDIRDDARDAYDEFRGGDAMEKVHELWALVPALERQQLSDIEAEQRDKKTPSVNQVRDSVNKLSTKMALMSAAIAKLQDDVEGKEDEINNLEEMRKRGLTWETMRDYVDQKLSYTGEAQRKLAYIERFETFEDTHIPPLRMLDMLQADVEREVQTRTARNEMPQSIAPLHRELQLIAETRAGLLRRDDGMPDVSSDTAWSSVPPEERSDVIRYMRNRLGINEYLVHTLKVSKEIASDLESRETALQKLPIEMSKRVKDVQFGVGNLQAGSPWTEDTSIFGALQKMRGNWERLKQQLGFETYTPIEMYLAGVELWESFEEMRKQSRRLKSSKLAAITARALAPILGHDFELILENSQVKKNDEVKNGFLEALKANSWDPGFDDMFKPGGILDQNFHDKNRTRAVLEFASTKGMLYDLSDPQASKAKKLFDRWNYRDLLPSEWSDKQVETYWGNLSADNALNTKKRAEVGKELAKNWEKADHFVEQITGAIKSHDLWLAKGMIERAFDKGKDGKFSAWMAVTIMEILRTDPFLRRYTPVEWLDQTGIISAKTAAFTMGHLNFQRNPFIIPWLRSGEESLSGAGNLGQVIQDVKTDIIAIDPSLDPKRALGEKEVQQRQVKLNELVGAVLATQLVELKDPSGRTHIISIFDMKYNYYNAGSGLQREVDVKELSDDFFNERSEILLCDASIIAKILEYGSTRLFLHEFRAKMLFSHAVKAQRELLDRAEKFPEQAVQLYQAAERFRTTFGEKMEAKFREFFRQRDSTTLVEFTLDDGVRPALAAMVQEGFVSLETMRDGLALSEGSKLARAILEQCEDAPDTPHDLNVRIKALLKQYPDPSVRRRQPPPASAANASQPSIAP